MICHDLKCIFVHIPRCAGTSIEKWIVGEDYWFIDRSSKHIIASQAKSLYSDYWNSYFKFSIVRNPFDRVRSCLKYKDHFGIELNSSGDIDFARYREIFGRDIVVEHDHRFHNRDELLSDRHLPGQVYGNILDEELDFVARFENIEADMRYVQTTLGIKEKFEIHVEASPSGSRKMLTRRDIEAVSNMYAKDFDIFSYHKGK